MKRYLLLIFTLALFMGTSSALFAADTKSATGVGAVMDTSKGAIHLTLYADKVPMTVANFVNLANRGYYDGLVFHRVIDNFMIQGGCPQGSGRGTPGYRFKDEFHPELRHSGPGILSMANAGANTNGSQFFITHVATPWLDNRHAVFGAVKSAKDQDVVNQIRRGDRIMKVTITGDTTALLSQQKEKIEEWNNTLDARYPRKR